MSDKDKVIPGLYDLCIPKAGNVVVVPKISSKEFSCFEANFNCIGKISTCLIVRVFLYDGRCFNECWAYVTENLLDKYIEAASLSNEDYVCLCFIIKTTGNRYGKLNIAVADKEELENYCRTITSPFVDRLPKSFSNVKDGCSIFKDMLEGKTAADKSSDEVINYEDYSYTYLMEHFNALDFECKRDSTFICSLREDNWDLEIGYLVTASEVNELIAGNKGRPVRATCNMNTGLIYCPKKVTYFNFFIVREERDKFLVKMERRDTL